MRGTTMVLQESSARRRHDAHPWYRQFWPWFLIVLPGASVVLSFLTLYMALETMDTVVPHDGVSTSYAAPSNPAAGSTTVPATESTVGAATARGTASATGAATSSK